METLVERDVSQDERDKLADKGHAMADGSFPIKHTGDLKNAVKAHGRAKDKAAAKAHICKRAKALGAEHMLPDEWKLSEAWDASAQRARAVEGHLAHMATDPGYDPLREAAGYTATLHPRDRLGRWREVPGSALAHVGAQAARADFSRSRSRGAGIVPPDARREAAIRATVLRRDAQSPAEKVRVNRGKSFGHARPRPPEPAASAPAHAPTAMMRNMDALAHDQFAALTVASKARARGGPRWQFTDNRGVKKEGYVEKVSDRGGTDITYFFRDDDDVLSVVSGPHVVRTKAGPLRDRKPDVWGDMHGRGVSITVQSHGSKGPEHFAAQAARHRATEKALRDRGEHAEAKGYGEMAANYEARAGGMSLEDLTRQHESMPKISKREANAEVRSMVADRAARLADETLPSSQSPEHLKTLSLSQLASVIRRDWGGKVNYAAKPYLDALGSLEQIEDNYGADPGRMIVAYFLSNATSWRGPTAKAVKAELKRRSGRR
jgi:hypothetical protein